MSLPVMQPTGTVTLLFTDIEGSTQLWERHPNFMGPVLARHDELLGREIAQAGGYVFKAVGDALCAAFADAAGAAAAALRIQQSLAAEAWGSGIRVRVRIALHAGSVEARGGDYFGPPLNRVARLRDAAHGGQIVLSQVTEQLLRDALPSGASLRPLGAHRFKDLAHPENVFQLQHPTLPDSFPPLRSLNLLPNNLPQRLDSFVGREHALADVKRLLTTTRLLTLTGVGGAGKTRLAQQAAAESLDLYPQGVWLASLEALTDPDLVPQAVGNAVGAREQPGQALTQTLRDVLRGQRVLLLLDNCEHLIEACAHLAQSLLEACPALQILATSREPLGIGGESVFPVPTLPLSAANSNASEPDSEAVRLFLDRAILSLPSFCLTPQNAPTIARICRQLDGIPLAIELAAPRVKMLTPEQISERLGNRSHLLTGGSRTALPRQQTMEAAIKWSHDLLSDPERRLFRRLSVFAGGWTLEAAEEICAGEGLDRDEVLECLSSLVAKSLVQVDESKGLGENRYRMLETLRRYSLDQLEAAALRSTFRDRHRDRFLALARAAEPELSSPEQAAWLNRLESEHDNLRAALDWCLDHDPESALDFAASLWRFWWMRGYYREGRSFLERTLAASASGDSLTRAKAFSGAGILAEAQGDYVTAVSRCEESLAIYQRLGADANVAGMLNNLGNTASSQGDWQRARDYYEQGLAIYRRLEDPGGIAILLMNRGIVANHQQDYDLAQTLYEESLVIFRRRKDLGPLAAVLLNLGELACNQKDYAFARRCLSESLQIAESLGEKERFASVLITLGYAAWPLGEYDKAAWLFGAATAILSSMGITLPPRDQIPFEENVAIVREKLGDQVFQDAWNRGSHAQPDQVVREAL